MPIEPIVERYLSAIDQMETAAIDRINGSLDKAFRSLTRELSARFSSNAPLASATPAALRLRTIEQLLRLCDPNNLRGWRGVMGSLLSQASAAGIDYATQVLRSSAPSGFELLSTVDVPIEAIKQASLSATQYLQRWGKQYASDVTTIIGQALAEGRGTKATGPLLKDLVASRFPALQQRTSVLKARVENIARTESLKASNAAAQEAFVAHDVDLFVWYATGDDRTCPYCWHRAGSLYLMKPEAITCHCRCRCSPAAVKSDWLAFDDSILAEAKAHYEAVKAKASSVPKLGAAPFEVGSANYPGTGMPSLVWSPSGGWKNRKIESAIKQSRV